MAGPLDNVDNGEVRAARADEAEEVLRTFCAAFGLTCAAARPIFYGDPFFDLSHKRVLRTPQHGIVSCLTLVPGTVRVGEAWVPIACIAGVATLPEHRGQGLAARLLAETLPALAGEFGYPLAGLFAQSDGLYRRLGWAIAAHAPRRRRLPPDWIWPASVHFLNPDATDEAAAVGRLHERWAQGRTGGFMRDGRRWQLIFGVTGRFTVVCQNSAQGVVGYAIFDRAGDSIDVQEAVGACADLLPPPEAAPEPPLMLRVVDVRGALGAIFAANLRPVLAAQGRALTLCARDAQRPENERPVRLSADGIVPGSQRETERISLDIGTLAQIFMGFRLPSEAARRGDLAADSAQTLALVDALFPLRAPCVAPLDNF